MGFHQVAYYTDVGIAASAAVVALSVYAASGAFANVVWGFLSERLSERLMAALALWAGGSQYGLFGALPADSFPGAPGAWRTMLFTTLVFSQLTLAIAERSRRSSLVQVGLFSNRYMLLAAGSTFCLQMAVIYVPAFQGFFSTVPLSAPQAAVCLALSLGMLLAVELEKLLMRAARPR